jgi:hypothetical protein
MQSAAPSENVLPASWPEVLAQVQQALQQAEEAAQKREQALEAEPVPDPAAAERETARRHCLERLQERLAGLEACAEQARQNVGDAEAAINAGEEVIRRWLAACQTVGQRLAERAAPGVR